MITIKQYTTISGDMWDTIAYKVLGNENYMDLLIQYNLEHKDLYIFPAGVVLNIPSVSLKPSASLPPWKKVGTT